MNGRNSDEAIRTTCLLVLAAIAVGAALYWLRPVMVPFVLAVFLAFILSPLVGLLSVRLRLPRGLAVLAALLLVMLVFVLVGGVVSTSLSELAANSSQYEKRLDELLQQASKALPLHFFGLDEAGIRKTLNELPRASLRDLLLSTTGAVLGLLSQGIIVMIFVAFLLLGTPVETTHQTGLWEQIRNQAIGYIFAKVALSSATGLLVAGILWMMGIDFAIAFGFLAFALNFIPNIGSIIATLLPVPVVLLTPGISLPYALAAVALPGIVQFVIGNFIEPAVMGDSLQLHPVTVLLALMFWGMLWGIVGMLLAVPITSTIKIVLERVEPARPFAALMAGNLAGGDGNSPARKTV